MSDLVIQPSHGLRGTIMLPGDKSLSHRAVLFSAIAEGDTIITGFLTGEDTQNTAKAVQALGIEVTGLGAERLVVHGKGLDGLSEPVDMLDLGNSGTGMRLLAGLLAGQNFFSVLSGDQYLRNRPMARIVEPLRQMGAFIDGRSNGRLAPLSIRGQLVVHSWVSDLLIAKAPRDFIAAVACLSDDRIAEKAYETIYRCKNRIQRARKERAE